jgi:hypothetical protein
LGATSRFFVYYDQVIDEDYKKLLLLLFILHKAGDSLGSKSPFRSYKKIPDFGEFHDCEYPFLADQPFY